jgi:ferredoxin
MNKFRRWIFKFLTGYDLVEYQEMLDFCTRCLKCAEECQENGRELVKDSREAIRLALEVNAECEEMLERCKEVNANEALD